MKKLNKKKSYAKRITSSGFMFVQDGSYFTPNGEQCNHEGQKIEAAKPKQPQPEVRTAADVTPAARE